MTKIMFNSPWLMAAAHGVAGDSLFDSDLFTAACILRERPGCWFMQREEAANGRITLQVIPGRPIGIRFLIERVMDELHVTTGGHPLLAPVATIEDAIAAIAAHLGKTTLTH